MNKVLLTCDLNCSRITAQQYWLICQKVREAHSEVDIQIYNYLAKKHTFVTANAYTTLHPYVGSHKRVTLDINQALDCIDYVVKNNTKEVYILCGEYDSEYLYNKLDNLGIRYHKIVLSASSVNIGERKYNVVDNECNIAPQSEDNSKCQETHSIPREVDDDIKHAVSSECKCAVADNIRNTQQQVEVIYNSKERENQNKSSSICEDTTSTLATKNSDIQYAASTTIDTENNEIVNLVNMPTQIQSHNNISKDQLKVLIKYVLDKKYCNMH